MTVLVAGASAPPESPASASSSRQGPRAGGRVHAESEAAIEAAGRPLIDVAWSTVDVRDIAAVAFRG